MQESIQKPIIEPKSIEVSFKKLKKRIQVEIDGINLSNYGRVYLQIFNKTLRFTFVKPGIYLGRVMKDPRAGLTRSRIYFTKVFLARKLVLDFCGKLPETKEERKIYLFAEKDKVRVFRYVSDLDVSLFKFKNHSVALIYYVKDRNDYFLLIPSFFFYTGSINWTFFTWFTVEIKENNNQKVIEITRLAEDIVAKGMLFFKKKDLVHFFIPSKTIPETFDFSKNANNIKYNDGILEVSF